VKFREVIQVIERDGWRLTRTQGSHRQFKRSIKPGTVTRAGKPNLRVPPGTLISRWSLHLGRKTGKRVRTMLRVEIGENLRALPAWWDQTNAGGSPSENKWANKQRQKDIRKLDLPAWSQGMWRAVVQVQLVPNALDEEKIKAVHRFYSIKS
jgi:predicted RNA binding protein YcfA (HicA-like mRNA interferase family)